MRDFITYGLENLDQVALGILALCALWVSYVYLKNSKKRKPRIRILAGIYVAVFLSIWIASLYFQSYYIDCEKHTQELGGGVHEFQGQKYVIRLCATRYFSNGVRVRMKILDEDGDLQALRYYTYYFNSVTERELSITPYSILYNDQSGRLETGRIAMPPSALDWIMARFPFLN